VFEIFGCCSGFRGFQVSGFRFRVPCFLFRIPGFKFRDSRFRVPGFGFRISCFGIREAPDALHEVDHYRDLRVNVCSLGFRV